MSLRIIFMGTSHFSIPILKSLLDNSFDIIGVYSQPPRKAKRGHKINISPLQEFAEKKHIKVRTPENMNNLNELNFFKNLDADLAVVVAYGQMIPKNFFKTTKLGFLNVHASLLPKWRGAAPIQRAIMNRDQKTGVSIMKIVEKLDSGPIMSFRELNLNSLSTSGEVENKLSNMGAKLLIECLRKIKKNQAVFTDQTENTATYAKKINKDESKIDWSLSADDLVAKIHALNPNPGAWFEFNNTRYKVWRAKKVEEKGKPGIILRDHLIVGCGSNAIEITEIQREGKNKQKITEFILGSVLKKNQNLNN